MRAAILGARRGESHAVAYRGVEGMELAAICDRDAAWLAMVCDRLERGGFGKLGRYTDYETMVREVRPDVLHIVTSPAIPRAKWFDVAVRYGVQALVLEKPYALTPAEKREVDEEAYKDHGMLVVVNHQRRYFNFALSWAWKLSTGLLGEIRHVYAQAQGEVMEMGTHVMDLVLMVMGDVPPTSVWAMAYGGKCYGMSHLLCPDNLYGVLTFHDRARAVVEVTTDRMAEPYMEAIINPEHRTEHHANRCSLYVWGTKGLAWWHEYGDYGILWRRVPESRTGASGDSDYFTDDPIAQRRFTQAIKEHLDGTAPHRCRFEIADLGLTLLFDMYASAYLGGRLSRGTLEDINERQVLLQSIWSGLRARLTKGHAHESGQIGDTQVCDGD